MKMDKLKSLFAKKERKIFGLKFGPLNLMVGYFNHAKSQLNVVKFTMMLCLVHFLGQEIFQR